MNRTLCLATMLVAFSTTTLPPLRAHACGGGAVSGIDAPVTVGAQRVFVSARASGTTDVVVQLDVDASADFGVLLPLPSEPTLDTEPVDSADLDTLDSSTQVHFVRASFESSGSSGCFCGGAGDGAPGGGGEDRQVTASDFVDIGPVTAVVLSADTGEALTTWLTDNGFTVSEEDQPVIDLYAGTGKYFIAVKRADGAEAGRTSVGLHFELDGDQRGYPLRMARMGAASELAITAFVVAPEGVGPTSPFEALTLNDIGSVEGESQSEISESYRTAVRAAVAEREGKAFLVEGVYDATSTLEETEQLAYFIDDGAKLTRLTTILAPSELDEDVAFTQPAPDNVPTEGDLARAEPASVKPKNRVMWGGLLLVLPLALRRMRKVRA